MQICCGQSCCLERPGYAFAGIGDPQLCKTQNSGIPGGGPGKAAADGASVAIAAKTADPNPKLPGTIFTAAKEIEAAGGVALPIQCDIRDEDQIAAAIATPRAQRACAARPAYLHCSMPTPIDA
jgi:hypothetical protein